LAKQTDDLQFGIRPVQPALAPPNPLPPRAAGQTTQPAIAEPPEDRQPDKVEAGTLIIGREISFSGEITACDRLVVDGIVEATLKRCNHVFIGDNGVFKGNARTENAEVSGRMEGELTVRKLLRIRAAGQVSGTTTYGEIEIERGGRIVGQAEAREGARQDGDW
jgi:cytoskeletal protein CcmA (bactofilin family)